jgi:hypothetical protein
MKSGSRYLISSIVLTAALAAPAAIRVVAAPQDNGRQDDNHHEDRDKDNKRIYDKSHNDYHNWDSDEDHRYHEYLTERHRDYRPFNELNAKDQRDYWNWRHAHEEHH